MLLLNLEKEKTLCLHKVEVRKTKETKGETRNSKNVMWMAMRSRMEKHIDSCIQNMIIDCRLREYLRVVGKDALVTTRARPKHKKNLYRDRAGG